MPQKAQLRRTVGMEAEHSSETIHTVVNFLNRTYHTVQNVGKRLELVFKTQSRRGNITLKNFRKPAKKIEPEKEIVSINDNFFVRGHFIIFMMVVLMSKHFLPTPINQTTIFCELQNSFFYNE